MRRLLYSDGKQVGCRSRARRHRPRRTSESLASAMPGIVDCKNHRGRTAKDTPEDPRRAFALAYYLPGSEIKHALILDFERSSDDIHTDDEAAPKPSRGLPNALEVQSC